MNFLQASSNTLTGFFRYYLICISLLNSRKSFIVRIVFFYSTNIYYLLASIKKCDHTKKPERFIYLPSSISLYNLAKISHYSLSQWVFNILIFKILNGLICLRWNPHIRERCRSIYHESSIIPSFEQYSRECNSIQAYGIILDILKYNSVTKNILCA